MIVMMSELGTDPQATNAPGKKRPRWLRRLGWALAAPFVFVFGGPGLVLLVVVSAGYLAVASVLELPLLYAVVTFAAVGAAIAFGAAARLVWPYRDGVDARPPSPMTIGDGPQAPKRRVLRWACAGAVIAAVCVTSWGLSRIFSTAAVNHPAGTFVALGLGALSGCAIVIAFNRAAGHGLSLYPSVGIITIVPAVVIAAGALLGAIGGWNDRTQGRLHDYCAYGSISSAQMQGCLDHVTLSRIDRLDTNAARFAQGSLNTCLYDSGPFCAQALNERNNAPSDGGQ